MYSIADLHAITGGEGKNAEELRSSTRSLAAHLIACGVDPEKCTLFVQSDVSGHAELTWVLGSITQMGWLDRMTQFKDKTRKSKTKPQLGLFSYPVLMTSDILLYDGEAVPVGDDQMQHLELARQIGRKFNSTYGGGESVLVSPRPLRLGPSVGRVMSLQNGRSKMSKSDASAYGCVYLNDSKDDIVKKVRKARTDAIGDVTDSLHDRPEVENMVRMIAAFEERDEGNVHAEMVGWNMKDTKTRLIDALVHRVTPIGDEARRIEDDPAYLDGVLDAGRERASAVASATISRVYDRVGLGWRSRGRTPGTRQFSTTTFQVAVKSERRQQDPFDEDFDDDLDDCVDTVSHKFRAAATAFKDQIKFEGRAGDGGMGSTSMVGGGRSHRKRPSGGDGGRGGSIIVEASSKVRSLSVDTVISAKPGSPGNRRGGKGKNADDRTVRVPLGTHVRVEFDHGGVNEFDMDTDGFVRILRGGGGGKGNKALRTSLTQKYNPEQAEAAALPHPGECATVELVLKTIADVGLVGFPNAGKSSLLRRLSRATPKVAPYPFATLHPNVGVCEYSDARSLSIADIPGIVEDAHKGRGLGFSFLRHIERTKVLLYVVDAAGPEAVSELSALRRELAEYDAGLLERPSLVVANKCDLLEDGENVVELTEHASDFGCACIPVSALHGDGARNLANRIRVLVDASDI